MWKRLCIVLVLLAAWTDTALALVLPHGIYYLTDFDNSTEPPNSVIGLSYVDGATLRIRWGTLNPSNGTYNWSVLDSSLGLVAVAGKKAQLLLAAGQQTPCWVHNAGAAVYVPTGNSVTLATFNSNCTASPSNRITQADSSGNIVPIPWDTTYEARLQTFINALAAHLTATNAPGTTVKEMSLITGVVGTGVTQTTAEVKLCVSGTAACATDTSGWTGVGYSRANVKSAFTTILGYWATAFPGVGLSERYTYDAFPQGFMPTGCSGADNLYPRELNELGHSAYPDRYVMGYNGVNDGPAATGPNGSGPGNLLPQMCPSTRTAATAWNSCENSAQDCQVGTDTNIFTPPVGVGCEGLQECNVEGGSCGSTTGFAGEWSVVQANLSKLLFIEVYPGDFTTANASSLTDAHTTLTAGGNAVSATAAIALGAERVLGSRTVATVSRSASVGLTLQRVSGIGPASVMGALRIGSETVTGSRTLTSIARSKSINLTEAVSGTATTNAITNRMGTLGINLAVTGVRTAKASRSGNVGSPLVSGLFASATRTTNINRSAGNRIFASAMSGIRSIPTAIARAATTTINPLVSVTRNGRTSRAGSSVIVEQMVGAAVTFTNTASRAASVRVLAFASGGSRTIAAARSAAARILTAQLAPVSRTVGIVSRAASSALTAVGITSISRTVFAGAHAAAVRVAALASATRTVQLSKAAATALTVAAHAARTVNTSVYSASIGFTSRISGAWSYVVKGVASLGFSPAVSSAGHTISAARSAVVNISNIISGTRFMPTVILRNAIVDIRNFIQGVISVIGPPQPARAVIIHAPLGPSQLLIVAPPV